MPKDLPIALRRLNRWAPVFVHEVVEGLAGAGGKGYLVGGVVRDAFLGRRGADWDVATDLTPDEVARAFPRIARTGEKHGTLLVIDEAGTSTVEVTTFRGEGPYLDGRRPSYVEFHQDVREDLARRDFTMNAIAADLNTPEIVDPFGGVDDIRRKLIRCVGDPLARFSEDGLRPLRAARFASTLTFNVDGQTEAALGEAMDVFEKVAWERKRVELEKLIVGPGLAKGIALLDRSGLLASMAPELSAAVPLSTLVELPKEPWLRMTAWGLSCGLTAGGLSELARRFKTSTATRKQVEAWAAASHSLPGPVEGAAFRHWLAGAGLLGAAGALEIFRARGGALAWYRKSKRKLRRPPPFRVADLAVGGADLQQLGIDGPKVGETLRALLRVVLDAPSRNRREVLLKAAHTLSTDP